MIIFLLIPAAVENDAVGLQPDQLVLHGHVVKPRRFGIDDEGVGKPQLVHEATVQPQCLVGVIVGQAVIVPALSQEHGHGVFLPGATQTRNVKAEPWAEMDQTRFTRTHIWSKSTV